MINVKFVFQILTFGKLWTDALNARRAGNASADATAEVQWYMSHLLVARAEDPPAYWLNHKHVYSKLAKTFLCMTASSVPCERIFSK